MLPLAVLSLPLECLPGAWFSPGPIPDTYNEPDIFGKSGIFSGMPHKIPNNGCRQSVQVD